MHFTLVLFLALVACPVKAAPLPKPKPLPAPHPSPAPISAPKPAPAPKLFEIVEQWPPPVCPQDLCDAWFPPFEDGNDDPGQDDTDGDSPDEDNLDLPAHMRHLRARQDENLDEGKDEATVKVNCACPWR